MRGDPVLRPLKRFEDDRVSLTVTGGLHYLRGNRLPYFSLTGEGFDHGSEYGGCCHERILTHYPELADLAALHLSDIDGAPMYALENGFFLLTDPGRDWKGEGGKTWEQRVKIACDHWRISAEQLQAEVIPLLGGGFSQTAGFLAKSYAANAKARVGAWVETQRPRWKREAEECIARHGLKVYGDYWEPGAGR